MGHLPAVLSAVGLESLHCACVSRQTLHLRRSPGTSAQASTASSRLLSQPSGRLPCRTNINKLNKLGTEDENIPFSPGVPPKILDILQVAHQIGPLSTQVEEYLNSASINQVTCVIAWTARPTHWGATQWLLPTSQRLTDFSKMRGWKPQTPTIIKHSWHTPSSLAPVQAQATLNCCLLFKSDTPKKKN